VILSPRRRLLLSLFALVAVFALGTLGYMVIERDPKPSLADAAYHTAITLSTVGFHEVWNLSPRARLWTVCIITFGIVTVSIALTSMTSLFLSGDLRYSRGRKKVEATIRQLKDHVILCGYGHMGSLAVDELMAREVPVVVVESNKETEGDLMKAKTLYVMGDATEEETLMQAGLMRAKALVATLPHDTDNVFITVTAHTLRPDLQIIARAEQPKTESKLRRAGATRVICAQIMGATRITNVITRPFIVDFVEVANKGVDLEMDEYVVTSDSTLCGVSLRDSSLRQKTGAMVVAIKRADGKAVFSPAPETILQPRDTLIIVGQAGVSDRLNSLDVQPGAA
jgi:voltage-gated potassium channel